MTRNSGRLKVLVVVDRGEGVSGPHRNVVSTLNALAAREDVELSVVCGSFDETASFASHDTNIQLGFNPHDLSKVMSNVASVMAAARNQDIIYVPTGLKSFLYAYFLKGSSKFVAGPNVTGFPAKGIDFVGTLANPGPLMTTYMSDAWIEMSEVRIQQCVRAGTRRADITFIPHAIDVVKFHPEKRDRNVWTQYGLDPEKPKLLQVGRFNHELKGTSVLLDAFRHIRASEPDVDLILIGKDGPYLTDEAKRDANIHYLGPIYGEALAIHLASADVFLGTSRYETFWFTPLEAMASGLPTVATNVGAVHEMIPDNGVQGWMVDVIRNDRHTSHAAERLAEPVIELLRSADERARMGARARERALHHFSEEELGRRLVELFWDVSHR